MNNENKRIVLLSNHKHQSEKIARQLKLKLKSARFDITNKDPNIVISIGGDGTLLSAFQKYVNDLEHIRFVGIHTGHLGFYTDYRSFEIDDLVHNLEIDRGLKVSYPILGIKLFFKNSTMEVKKALNEATIKRVGKTMVADLVINHVHFERFRGDGISVSTPTGSTAYNKSLGGSILHPTIEALQLSEVASLNNQVYRTLGSSIIIPKTDKIYLIPLRNDEYVLSVDNRTFTYRDIKKIEYQIDPHKINFLSTPSHMNFWTRVKESFIGSVVQEL